MPVLKLKHVVSCSSEDEKHPADNILKPETYYKWRCSSGGETNATIVLQLEKASQISGLDIGNNGSAFIEVLVGRSSWSQSEEFKVLLAASTFMTPADSKAGKEVSRVRMFGLENVNKLVAAEKWDQIKIVCTQPYNTSEPYGLSFIKLYTPIDEQSIGNKEDQKSSVSLGRFKLKSDSDDESKGLSSGSFFQKRMNISVEPAATPKMSMAASARSNEPSPRASTTIFKTTDEDPPACSKKMSISEDRRQEVASALLQGSENKHEKGKLLFNLNKVKPSTPQGQKVKKNSEVTKRKMEDNASYEKKAQDVVSPPTKKLKDIPKQNNEKSSVQTSSAGKSDSLKNEQQDTPTASVGISETPKRAKVKKRNVPHCNILEGVIFALSGYQNPERSNIRDLALYMGAKYEASWSNRCTHLICAFANTPKFKEVKGKGKIVRKKWIDECDKNKRRLNTKNYRLDGGGSSSFESSGSDDENIDSIENSGEKTKKQSSSECDTEGELEKIRMLDKKSSEKEKSSVTSDQTKSLAEGDNIYDAPTDDDEAENVSDNAPSIIKETSDLPKFFGNKQFFLYGDFDPKDSRLLKRHITAYSGSVSDYMRESTDFVISEEKWDTNFQKAFDDNSSLVFLQPKWIFKCHEKQMFVPYENYEIKPSPS